MHGFTINNSERPDQFISHKNIPYIFLCLCMAEKIFVSLSVHNLELVFSWPQYRMLNWNERKINVLKLIRNGKLISQFKPCCIFSLFD